MKIESDEEIMPELNEDEIELELPRLEFKEAPIQLIEFEGHTFKLNEEAIKLLKSIEEEIIVVSIVGKARTGKSYLMNLLLENIGKNSGVINIFLIFYTISSSK
jgi:ATPase subunit of ABC transporter with duplicated ATPase domains